MKMDAAVGDIRRRFGFYSIQRGLMLGDTILSTVNAKRKSIRFIHMVTFKNGTFGVIH